MLEIDRYLSLEQTVKDPGAPTIHGVPVWRLVRTQFRWKYRGTFPFTVKPKIRPWELFRNTFISFWGLLKLYIHGKMYKNVFFPHPRLFYVNGYYMERFSDPLIDAAGIAGDSIILERHQNGIHKRPRYHADITVYLDFIDNVSTCLSTLVSPFLRMKYGHLVDTLYERLDDTFQLNDRSYKSLFYKIISGFVISRRLIHPLLRRLSPERVFVAPRGTYDHVVECCKERGITVIELQHGIVLGKTDLYSGDYDPRIDPDYFFVFGKSNIGGQYGMPLGRIVSIGFPFKDFIKKTSTNLFDDKVVLVISEPQITGKLLAFLARILDEYPGYEFHFRCHPQETVSEDQKKSVERYKGIVFVDNTVESFSALCQYQTIIGENSSVLFEAMSLHKKVGRLMLDGTNFLETELLHGGCPIRSPRDFDSFMTSHYSDENDSKEVYSDYSPNALKTIGL